MTGLINGVVTHIKVKVPLFLATHCVVYRLLLASVDASGDSRLVSNFQSLINEIYTVRYFFQAALSTLSSLERSKKQ